VGSCTTSIDQDGKNLLFVSADTSIINETPELLIEADCGIDSEEFRCTVEGSPHSNSREHSASVDG